MTRSPAKPARSKRHVKKVSEPDALTLDDEFAKGVGYESSTS